MTYAEYMARMIVGGDLSDDEAMSFVSIIIERCAQAADTKQPHTCADYPECRAAARIRALATEAQP